ncbi:TetR family transcriptional regulator [Candidatus Solincola sp.]|nr:TetR/AcrR family transcriptional regulator [Actinomycetota bacterium]
MKERKELSRRERGLRTRQRIYKTAIDLFARKGYENVSVDEICRRLGMTKGAFYAHFRSKDQIILEEFMNMDRHYAVVAESLPVEANSLDKLRTFNREAIRLMSDLGVTLMKVLYHSQIAPHMREPYLVNPGRNLYRITNRLIREGQERGEIRSDLPPEELTTVLINAFRGQLYHWCLTDGSFDLLEACERLMELILRGIRA